MTRYLVHAIASTTTEPPGGLQGLDRRPLVGLDAAELTAFATELSEDAVTALGRDALLAHHALVSQLHDVLDGVLPVRFPTLIDAAGMRAQLAQHASGYAAALSRVHGRVEVALSAVWEPATAPADAADVHLEEASTSGAEYMRRRQRELHAARAINDRAADLADALTRALPPGAEIAAKRIAPSTELALSIAYLVQRAAARDVIATLGRPRPDVRILINGPWPPYSFATVVREA